MTPKFAQLLNHIAIGHPVCLDLDFDFFFNAEHWTGDVWRQKRFNKPLFDEFLSAHNFAAFTPIVGHDEALQHWIDKPLSRAVCVHIDFHHDWYMAPSDLESASLRYLDSQITCGNYLAVAAKAGIISQLVWVYPDGYKNVAPPSLPMAMTRLGIDCVLIPYSDYCHQLLPVLQNAAIASAIASLSPDFISGDSLPFFFDTFGCDVEFRFRALDYAYERIVSSRRNPCWKWYRTDLSAQSVFAYHGSPHAGLQQLTASENGVFVSPSLRFAACYESQNMKAGWWRQGVELLSDDPETVIVHTNNNLTGGLAAEIVEGSAGSTYVIATGQKARAVPNSCPGFEQLLKSPVKPVAEYFKQLPTAVTKDAALLFYGNDIALALPDAFEDFDWSDFVSWMDTDQDVLLAYRSTPFFMILFQQLREAAKPTIPFPLVYWRRLAERILFADLPAYNVKTEANGYHGLEHGLEVALTTLLLAYENHTSPLAGFLAALLHDLSTSTAPHAHTPKGSAELAADLLADAWLYFSGQADAEVIEAVRTHAAVSPPPSNTAAYVRDADRLRLAWERGYEAHYFASDLGHELAQRYPDYHAGLIRRFSFDKPVILELNTTEKNTRKNTGQSITMTVWNLGRRYLLGSFPQLTTEMLNWYIAWLNVTTVYDLSTDLALSDLDLSRIIGGVKLRKVSAAPDRKAHMLAENLTDLDDCIALAETDAPVQYLVSDSNFDSTLYHLATLASRGCDLVFNDRSPTADERLKVLANALDDVKRRDEDAVSCRIITEMAWCHIESIDCALRVLAKAQDAYAPVTGFNVNPLNAPEEIFEAILLEERKKYNCCGNCAFSLNCVRQPPLHTGSQNGCPIDSAPAYFEKFKIWDFYDAY